MLQSFRCSIGQVRRWHHGQNGVFSCFLVLLVQKLSQQSFRPTAHSVRKWAVGAWAARPGGGTTTSQLVVVEQWSYCSESLTNCGSSVFLGIWNSTTGHQYTEKQFDSKACEVCCTDRPSVKLTGNQQLAIVTHTKPSQGWIVHSATRSTRQSKIWVS